MKPIEWEGIVLKRNGLIKPDGRPLYQYRITDEEFNQLEVILKDSVSSGLSSASKRTLKWDSIMVAYAAEWWRRHYSGKWGWEKVFSSIGFEYDDLTINARNTLIEKGLRSWGRSVRSISGRRHFLGTIATEGGLPLRQLSDGGGWLKNILSIVLRRSLTRGLAVDALIEANQSYIPKSYRSSEVKVILEDIITVISKLREEQQLESKSNPVDWLDNNIPAWRDSFPLPVDDEAGKALLSELIDVASSSSSATDEDSESVFELQRFIKEKYGELTFYGRIDLPLKVPLELIASEIMDDLPGRVDIEVITDDGIDLPWCNATLTTIKGDKCYKLNGRGAFKLEQQNAFAGIKVRAKSMGEVLFELPVMFGDRLESDSPWLFKVSGSQYEYFGSDSQSVREKEAVVYLPQSLTVNFSDENSKLDKIGSFLNGSLYRLEGAIDCKSNSTRYTFKTNNQDSHLSYELVGHLHTGISHSGYSNPSTIFLGAPDVYQKNKLTGLREKLKTGRAIAKLTGTEDSWAPIKDIKNGVNEIRIVEDGVIKWRRRVGILDESFTIQLRSNNTSPLTGSVCVEGISGSQVEVRADNCTSRVVQESGQALIKLTARDSIPKSILLCIFSTHSNKNILLETPYPSSGALLFDSKGNGISMVNPLYLNDLHGYRVHVYAEKYQAKTLKLAELRFSLIDPDLPRASSRDIYKLKRVKLKDSVTELSLSDWRYVIERMLGVGSLDSYVQASLTVDGYEKFKINFYRYQNELKGIWSQGFVTLDEGSLKSLTSEALQGIKLSTIRLNQPEQASADLIPVTSEGVSTGYWDFSPNQREKGSWLIYPDKTSSIKFRPLLWLNTEISVEEIEDATSIDRIKTLAKATELFNREEREQAIRTVLNLMSDDFEHKSWDYLLNLMGKVDHLSLAAFDVWRISVSEPKFLASLFLKSGFEEVVKRLEEELPIIWELVRLKHWINAFSNYQSLFFGLDDLTIKGLMSPKIESINELSPSMNCTTKVLRSIILDEQDRELSLMSQPIEFMLKGKIFEEQQCLLRRHAEREWPGMLSFQLKEIFSTLPPALKSLVNIQHQHQLAVTILPIVLAWRNYTEEEYGWLGNPVNIFKLDELKEFDSDWFDAVFNFTSGWISQNLTDFSKEKTNA